MLPVSVKRMYPSDSLDTRVLALFLRSRTSYFPIKKPNLFSVIQKMLDTGYALISWQGNKPVALVVLIPCEKYMKVLHFYSESKLATPALKREAIGFIRSLGYTRLRAKNGSKLPEEKWLKIFHLDGWRMQRIGDEYEFEVENG